MSKQTFRKLVILAIVAPVAIGFFFVLILIGAIEDTAAARLPFSFTADIYDAVPNEVCPGDVIEWQRTVVVNAPVNTVTTLLWIDPDSQRVQSIRDSTRQFIFVSNKSLSEYYLTELGREVESNEYPLTVSDTLTATVPAFVKDGPLLLQETTVLEAREGDDYTVPVWVLSEDECLDRR
jgi:hypothetical protein